MHVPWIQALLSSFFIAAILTPVITRLSTFLGVIDRPTDEAKKVHHKPIPLLGGTAIFLAIAILVVYALFHTVALTSGLIDPHQYVGFLLGGLVLIAGGYLDDKYTLPPKVTVLFPFVAALIAVGFGIGVSKVSNPLGGNPIDVPQLTSQIITFAWLMIVMYVTKFLDGLDGLATGVSAIGAAMMMGLALTVQYFQPDAAVFAAICLGAMLGFLVWNFDPAEIFLGEGGSTFVGYTIGVLAVIGGAKVGTALLVLSIPFLDVIWVVLRRTLIEHHSPTKGDRKHLHHRLLDLGLSQRQVVLIYYAIAAVVGMSTLFLQSQQKLILFGFIVVAMISVAIAIVLTERKRRL